MSRALSVVTVVNGGPSSSHDMLGVSAASGYNPWGLGGEPCLGAPFDRDRGRLIGWGDLVVRAIRTGRRPLFGRHAVDREVRDRAGRDGDRLASAGWRQNGRRAD